MVITTPHQKADGEALAASLGGLRARSTPNATMHTPVEVTEDALAEVQRRGADCLVALGGGSTIGLAKAIALRTDLPQIAIPTTYAGSEMTPILGETKDGRKTTQKSMKVLPEVVIYDVDLTMTLPAGPFRHLRHQRHRPFGRGALRRRLPTRSSACSPSRASPRSGGRCRSIAANPGDREARSDAQYGAFLAGACLGSVGMALHHKLCHTLGGLFDLPHSETHTIVLPHALAYNAPAVPKAVEAVARALGVADAPRGIFDLARKVGAPRSLQGDRHAGKRHRRGDRPRAFQSILEPAPAGAGRRSAELIARAWAGEEPRPGGVMADLGAIPGRTVPACFSGRKTMA